MRPRAYYEAIATLTGCIIGAGVLGIPYMVVRSGFWTGMLMIVVLGLASLLVHLLVGEVALRTKACHQLVGLAEKYLGKHGKFGMLASMIVGVYGALIAYTIGVGRSLAVIVGGPEWAWSVAFYVVMSALVFGSILVLARSELFLESVKFLVLFAVLLVLFLSRHFDVAKLSGFSWQNFLVPYGVILFAYLGTAAIPEVREEMRVCPRFTRRAIVIGSLLPVLAYALFTAAVVGVSGAYTSEVATIVLGQMVGPFGFLMLHVFAILAMATSFIALGYALKQSYHEDFHLPVVESWALVVVVPAVLMVLGAQSFVRTLDVAGTFAGGIAGILIVLMHARAKKFGEREPEYRLTLPKAAYGLLIVLFAVGMLYQVVLLL
ncbi:hypothetical protein C4580_05680 [Candidatus Woesearchaeota archaeon]|nr:MAG: hypothetical protein C4580_05680 [Candidatus Woesearchaeota archaeon]